MAEDGLETPLEGDDQEYFQLAMGLMLDRYGAQRFSRVDIERFIASHPFVGIKMLTKDGHMELTMVTQPPHLA